MISLIYGEKGSGKTQKIIDAVNEKAKVAKGNVVFISAVDKYSLYIDKSVRFVASKDYYIDGTQSLTSFIMGMIAGNSDICDFYIDGIARIGNVDVEEAIFIFDGISAKYNVNFTITLSMAQVPDKLKRFI